MKINAKDKQILRIAIPSIVTNITVPLLGLVDVGIVGHIGNAAYIGAIAVGTTIFNIIYWMFGFLRMGTGGLTSQAYGKRDLKEIVLLLGRSLTIALGVSAIMLVLQKFIFLAAVDFIAPSSETAHLVAIYFNICVWGIPAMLCLYGLTGWFIGMQNTRIPMFVSITQNIVNIAASMFLVFGMGMKIDGVATGTVIAQYAGLVMALMFLFWRYGRLRKYFDHRQLFCKQSMLQFFKVNRDIFLRTLFFISVNLYFTHVGAVQGDVILAVNTLLLQMFTIFSYVMDGFAYAAEALSGKFYGARNRCALDEIIRRLFGWGLAMAVLFTSVYMLGGRSFLSLLTSDAMVLDASSEYFMWAVLIPIAGIAAFIWDGIFIGITETAGMLLSSMIAAVVFFSIYLTASPYIYNHALWMAFISFLAARGISQTFIYNVKKKNIPF